MSGLGALLMIVGTVFSLLAAWGIVDFPTPISRLHAATKSASLGLSMIALGAGVASGSWDLFGVGAMITEFLFVTAPISGHMIGRSAYLAGQQGDLVHDDFFSTTSAPVELGRPRRTGVRVSHWIILVVVWMLLWRDISVGTAIGGALVAVVVETAQRRFPAESRVDLLGFARFLFHYAVMVVASTLRVAWEVITPNNETIREAIVGVELQTRSIDTALLVANAVSFTPGTLTIELTSEPLTIYAHILHFTNPEDVRESIARLEELATRAFPPA
jgi:multicomponent Na+:H+ antiporter subunit E